MLITIVLSIQYYTNFSKFAKIIIAMNFNMKIDLPDFTKGRILVVGDVMLDRYWYSSSNKLSTESPVPICHVTSKNDSPGGAANVAMNIAALGSTVYLISFVGKDRAAKILYSKLKKANIFCDFISSYSYSTIIKLRILAQNKQLVRIDFEKQSECFNVQELFRRVKNILSNVDAIIISDYGKGTLKEISKLISLANSASIPVFIDPKGKCFNEYAYASILTPNMYEFERVVGKCVNNQDIKNKGMNLINSLNLQQGLLITRSELGMTLLQRDNKITHLPAYTMHNVYDSTGAGDTVIAVLAASLIVKCDIYHACKLANIAASLVVKKLGTTSISFPEFKQAVYYPYNNNNYNIRKYKLKELVISLRNAGKTIVMTNGCFDILHAGHIQFLLQASKLGDFLIVAINSDSSIKRLKGLNRPINSLSDRVTILQALKMVDLVISFTEDTPKRIIIEIMPDILVKGSDYQLDNIVGAKEVLAAGGKVKIIKIKKKISATNIISKIKKD
uniref:Bifunctional protein HldE n=1 Tax=Candidatus Aschnera chinzeii TaxID=1485666 RepID=A0AAT9G418_9ENTR|nr:MAG: bifunctional D-glycero-beta-D-manno-heptose-7-phosphate kinase/D-glycero-beta-D-manno-heptose 1-phosphate adenylyltransferase HldE [Candidatus Aschnera chinzeii]